MEAIAPDLWRWTRRHPEWHPRGFGEQVASFALKDAAGLVLIDPLLDDEADPELAEIEALAEGSVRILITIPYHVRDAGLIWRRLHGSVDAAIYGHARCASRLEETSGFHAVRGGETLAGGIRVHSIGKPRRMEVPFELPSQRALAFGDAIVETGKGRLRVWRQWGEVPDGWYPARFLPTLRPLARLEIDRVLVTHGAPVLEHGARALERALAAPPWSAA